MAVDTRRRLEDLPRSRLNSASGLGRPGVHPVSSVIGLVLHGAGSDPPLWFPTAWIWWRRVDSNALPPPCKGDALPTELRPPLGPEVWWAFLDSNQRPLPYQG